jgi:hypothetical protein
MKHEIKFTFQKNKSMKTKTIPTRDENPKGLYQRYLIKKIVPKTGAEFAIGTKQYKLISVDKDAEYFVLRVDKNGSDPKHILACRKAVIKYAIEIRDYLPELSADLIERYSDEPTPQPEPVQEVKPTAEEVLKRWLLNPSFGDIKELEKELNENKDQVAVIINAMHEYHRIHSNKPVNDWKKFRTEFFNKCTDTIDNQLKVTYSPHDLFEWIKSYIEGEQK